MREEERGDDDEDDEEQTERRADGDQDDLSRAQPCSSMTTQARLQRGNDVTRNSKSISVH